MQKLTKSKNNFYLKIKILDYSFSSGDRVKIFQMVVVSIGENFYLFVFINHMNKKAKQSTKKVYLGSILVRLYFHFIFIGFRWIKVQ